MANPQPINKPQSFSLGTNIAAVRNGDTLTLTIDLSNRAGTSASGKSVIVATTSGNKGVPGTDVVIGFNAYVKAS